MLKFKISKITSLHPVFLWILLDETWLKWRETHLKLCMLTNTLADVSGVFVVRFSDLEIDTQLGTECDLVSCQKKLVASSV
jgi:hypothetical protein